MQMPIRLTLNTVTMIVMIMYCSSYNNRNKKHLKIDSKRQIVFMQYKIDKIVLFILELKSEENVLVLS